MSAAVATSRSPLRNRNYALLWLGGLVSDLGDWTLLIALPVFVFQLTGSALTTSTVFVAELIPGLIVGQIAGVYVDRLDRRRILVVASVAQAILLLPILLVTSPDLLWIVYLVAAAESCLARICSPAKNALIPSLVPRDQLVAANSLSAVSDNVARLVGSPLGGVAIQFLGLVGVVALDAATFLASAILTALVVVPRATSAADQPGQPGRPESSNQARDGFVADWLDGLRTIRRSPVLTGYLGIGALGQLAQGIFVVLFVVFVLERLGGSGSDVGLIRGMQAIGGVLGGLVVGRLSRRFGAPALVQWGYLAFGVIALATWNAPLITTAIWVYVTLFILAGIPGVALSTGLLTSVQAAAPPTHLGRVFAAYETGSAALQAVGVLIAGALADRIGVTPILDAQAIIYLACGALAYVIARSTSTSGGPQDGAGVGGPRG